MFPFFSSGYIDVFECWWFHVCTKLFDPNGSKISERQEKIVDNGR
jgi:hypothetical protein